MVDNGFTKGKEILQQKTKQVYMYGITFGNTFFVIFIPTFLSWFPHSSRKDALCNQKVVIVLYFSMKTYIVGTH